MRSLKQIIIQRWPVGPKLWVSLIFLLVLFVVAVMVPTFLALNLKAFLPTLAVWLGALYALLNGLLFVISPFSLSLSRYKSSLISLFNLSYLLLCFAWLLLVDLRLESLVSLLQILCLFMVFFLLRVVLNYIHQDLKEGWQTRLWNFNARPETKKINYRPELN